MMDLERYRTPSLATLSPERLAQVVEENRRELIALDRDHAYRSAHWALELIDALAGRVGVLEAALPTGDAAAAGTAKSRRPARG